MEIIARGQITIWNYKDGDDAYSVILNHDTHAVACDPSGNALGGELGPSGKAVFVLSAYRGATKLTMRYSSAASTAGMCAWKFGTISGCTAAQMSGSNEKFYINTMTADSAYVEIVCSVDGKASITKRVTIVKQKKGDTGDPGEPGDDGKQGCMLRPRGTWTAQTQYVYNDQYRDVVLYNNSVYIVKATHTSAVSFESSKWEPFNEFINVATSVLLANKGYIDVLGAARLFVGDTNKSTGWEMTNGYIKHIKSGLTLTADGKLYDPDGLHLSVGGKTVQAIVDGAVDGIQVGGRNILKNSDFSKDISGWTMNSSTYQVKTDSVYGTYLEFKHAGVGNISGNRISQLPFYTGKGHETGKTYSLSFLAKAAKAVTIKAGEAYNLNSFAVTTQWKRYSITYVAKNTGSLTFNVAEANVLLSLTQIKLEEGTKATDWTPAPEDVSVKIEENSSKIEQLPDQISLTVDQKIENVQIGNRNILKDSGSKVIPSGTSYFIRKYESTIQFETGKKYTVVIKGSTSIGQSFGLWVNGASINVGHFPSNMTGGVEYKHITMPSNIGTPSVSTLHLYNYPDPKGTSKPCEIEWIAMYEGHIKPPMDWTPAVEDLTKKIEENSSKIEQLPGQISLTVDKKIQDIQVGGRNYIQNSTFMHDFDKWNKYNYNGNFSIGLHNGKYSLLIERTGYSGSTRHGVSQIINTNLKAGEYTLSLKYRSNQFDGTRNQIFVRIYSTASAFVDKGIITIPNTQGGDSDGQITFNVDSNVYKAELYVVLDKNGYLRVWDIKLEQGNKATDWSPAPEDADNSISNLSSEIKQTAENINLKVNQVIGGENMLSNTSFSADYQGWNLLNNTTGMTANIVTMGGYKCLELWTDGARRGLYSYVDNKDLIKVGSQYTISFDLYRTSSAVSTLAIGLEDGGADFIKKTLSGNLNTWVRLTYTQKMDTNNAAFVIYGAGNAGAVYIKNIKVEMGTIATAWTPSPLEQNNKLLATGIDIFNKKLVLTADNTLIQSNDGKQIAMFTVKNGKPLLSAENIDAENLAVKRLHAYNEATATNFDINGNSATVVMSQSSPQALSSQLKIDMEKEEPGAGVDLRQYPSINLKGFCAGTALANVSEHDINIHGARFSKYQYTTPEIKNVCHCGPDYIAIGKYGLSGIQNYIRISTDSIKLKSNSISSIARTEAVDIGGIKLFFIQGLYVGQGQDWDDVNNEFLTDDPFTNKDII